MPPTPRPNPTDREERLDGVLVDYLEAIEAGVEPDRRAILARHPDLFDELSDFFADRDAIEPLARPLRALNQDSGLDRAWAELDPPQMAGHLGRLGSYEVVDWLGMGGMGLVYQGYDPSLDRPVAIKVLAPQWAADPDAGRRFGREARSAAAICHPHVVTIHAVGEWRGRPYLVMEYVPGPTLQERLDESGPLPLVEILTIALQVASALAAAHAQGLIHRDVKPANILLENGLARARLTDFGLARAVDDARVTQLGLVAGTPQYMAPEQARGEVLDRRADLFSLGGVIFAMCTGSAPFRGSSTPEVLRRVCDEAPPSLRRVQPAVPDWLAAIVARLLSKRPADRFESAAEVAELLARHLARLRDPSLPPVRRPRASGRQRRWGAALLATGLLAISVAGWALVMSRSPRRTSPEPGESGATPAAHHQWPTVDVALPDLPADASTHVSAYPEPDRLGRVLRWDLAAGSGPIRGLRLVGTADLPGAVTRDAAGLQIAVPHGLAATPGVEVVGPLVGDFEITATLDHLGDAVEQPDGHGVGPELTIRAEASGAVASIARSKGRSVGGDDLALTLLTLGPGGQPQILGRWPRAAEQAARFRLVRLGSKLHYLVAEGEGPFRDLFRVEFGAGPVAGPRFSFDPGHSGLGGAVRLRALEVHAEGGANPSGELLTLSSSPSLSPGPPLETSHEP